jgi:hypothetical protein
MCPLGWQIEIFLGRLKFFNFGSLKIFLGRLLLRIFVDNPSQGVLPCGHPPRGPTQLRGRQGRPSQLNLRFILPCSLYNKEVR